MRRERVYKKFYEPDPQFGRIDIGRFINSVMRDGKKSIAEKIVFDAFEHLRKETKEDPIVIFEKAIENTSPALEVRSRRIGGANYQVPYEVRPARRFTLAVRWIIAGARARTGKPMAKRLSEELLAASKGEGSAIKKKQDMHRMAEGNRAFAHFAKSPKKKVNV